MHGRTIAVWDPLVRLFHWCLVVSYAVAWLTAEEWDAVHEWAGYIVGGLIVFRILWGFVGPRYARFGQFVKSRATVTGYLGDIVKGRERRYIGHNPAGGVMVVALLLAVGGTAATGWMMTLDMFWGTAWVEGIHEFLANLTLFLVFTHVGGVILASLRHKENLVRSMVIGHKRAPTSGDIT